MAKRPMFKFNVYIAGPEGSRCVEAIGTNLLDTAIGQELMLKAGERITTVIEVNKIKNEAKRRLVEDGFWRTGTTSSCSSDEDSDRLFEDPAWPISN